MEQFDKWFLELDEQLEILKNTRIPEDYMKIDLLDEE